MGDPEGSPVSLKFERSAFCSVGAAGVGVVLGLDVDSFADVDEQRHLDDQPGLHDGRLINVVGGVAFDAFG